MDMASSTTRNLDLKLIKDSGKKISETVKELNTMKREKRYTKAFTGAARRVVKALCISSTMRNLNWLQYFTRVNGKTISTMGLESNMTKRESSKI